MSVLVSWTYASAGPLLRGLWPNGLASEDFDMSPDTETVANLYISKFNGDPASVGAFGMELFTMPVPAPSPEISITSISCEDPSFYYNKESGFIAVKAGSLLVASATISNFPNAESWNTPIYRNGSLEGYIATSSDGKGNVSFSMTFPQTGLWEVSEEIINEGIPLAHQFVMKLGLTVKVST